MAARGSSADVPHRPGQCFYSAMTGPYLCTQECSSTAIFFPSKLSSECTDDVLQFHCSAAVVCPLRSVGRQFTAQCGAGHRALCREARCLVDRSPAYQNFTYVSGKLFSGKLFELAVRQYLVAERRVDRGEMSWGALTRSLRREVNEVIGKLQSAADQGFADAQHSLGLMFHHGQGVTQSDGGAVRWWRKAPGQGHAKSQVSLGQMYGQGRGMRQDSSEARRWFLKAAHQGLAEA
jgi:hypothetical protein